MKNHIQRGDITLNMKNDIKCYEFMLWKYEYEVKHDQNNIPDKVEELSTKTAIETF